MALFPKVGRKQPHVRAIWWLVVGVLCLGIFLHLLPFYFMITTSLKSAEETMAQVPTLWPQHLTLSAWRLAFAIVGLSDDTSKMIIQSDPNQPAFISPFFTYFLNSLFMTFMTLIISLPITSLSAYATSKLMRGPIARWSFIFFIGTMMVPGAVLLLPRLLLVKNFPFALTPGSIPLLPGSEDPFPTLDFHDTAWAVIIPGLFNGFNYLLFKGFFDGIPNSVIQAAQVDGGAEFNIFRRIVLPMSIPVYAVATWLQFGSVWDDFLWPSLAIPTPEKSPTSVAIYTIIYRLMNAGATDQQQIHASVAIQQILKTGLSWNGMMVLGILQTLPIFIMFIICREYLLKGIRIRGLK